MTRQTSQHADAFRLAKVLKGMAMVISMRFSLFPYRGLESLLSLFRCRIQFILWLGCVPLPIVAFSHPLHGWFSFQRLGSLYFSSSGELHEKADEVATLGSYHSKLMISVGEQRYSSLSGFRSSVRGRLPESFRPRRGLELSLHFWSYVFDLILIV